MELTLGKDVCFGIPAIAQTARPARGKPYTILKQAERDERRAVELGKGGRKDAKDGKLLWRAAAVYTVWSIADATLAQGERAEISKRAAGE